MIKVYKTKLKSAKRYVQPNVIFIDSILSSVYKSKLLHLFHLKQVIMQSHTGLVGLNLNKICEITSAIIC